MGHRTASACRKGFAAFFVRDESKRYWTRGTYRQHTRQPATRAPFLAEVHRHSGCLRDPASWTSTDFDETRGLCPATQSCIRSWQNKNYRSARRKYIYFLFDLVWTRLMVRPPGHCRLHRRGRKIPRTQPPPPPSASSFRSLRGPSQGTVRMRTKTTGEERN